MANAVGPSKRNPLSLLKLSANAWINGRWDWDPELALHLCKVVPKINDLMFDCSVQTLLYKCNWPDMCNMVHGMKTRYYYLFLKEIVEWENGEEGKDLPQYGRRMAAIRNPESKRWYHSCMADRRDYVTLEDCPDDERRASRIRRSRLLKCRKQLF